jgi:hypothetical protein
MRSASVTSARTLRVEKHVGEFMGNLPKSVQDQKKGKRIPQDTRDIEGSVILRSAHGGRAHRQHGVGRNSRPAKRQSNFSPRAPKHRRKTGNTRNQRARRINNLQNSAKLAKPPSPVQIRAADPTGSSSFGWQANLRNLIQPPEDGGTERTGVVWPPSRVSRSLTTNGPGETPKGGRR